MFDQQPVTTEPFFADTDRVVFIGDVEISRAGLAPNLAVRGACGGGS